MTPISRDLKTTMCSFSNQSLDTFKSQKNDNAPYLFVSNDERIIWYDAQTFQDRFADIPSTIKKIHVFAQFTSGIFFIGECEPQKLKPLYLQATEESLRQETNDNDLVNALSFHYKAGSELFTRMKEAVDDDRISLIVGRVFLRVNASEDDWQKAYAIFLTLAKKENPVGCYEYGKMLPKGANGNSQYKWYEKAALAKHPEASYEAAIILEERGDSTKDDLMRQFFRQAADTNGDAAFKAAMMYKNGKGGEFDLEIAQELFLKSVETMGSEALYQLGLVNLDLGFPLAAFGYLNRAANEDHKGAQKELEQLIHPEPESSKEGSSSKKSDIASIGAGSNRSGTFSERSPVESSSSRRPSGRTSLRAPSASPSAARRSALVSPIRSQSLGDMPDAVLTNSGSDNDNKDPK